MRFAPACSYLLAALALTAGPALAAGQPAGKDQPKSGAKAEAKEPSENLHDGMVEAAYLGLYTEAIPLERAGDLGLPPGTGLSVVGILPGSPAEKAGFQKHDVLTKIDEHLLVNPAQLRVLVRLHKGGDAVAFQLVRKGQKQTLKAELGSQPMPELTPGGEEPRDTLHGLPGGGFRAFPPRGGLPRELQEELRRLHPDFGCDDKDCETNDGKDDGKGKSQDAPSKEGIKAGQSF